MKISQHLYNHAIWWSNGCDYFNDLEWQAQMAELYSTIAVDYAHRDLSVPTYLSQSMMDDVLIINSIYYLLLRELALEEEQQEQQP